MTFCIAFSIYQLPASYKNLSFIILQRMDCMWAQIKHLQRNNWTEKQIMRPYVAFDSTLSDALQHTLPTIIPPSHHEDALYPLPRVVFRMFDYTDVPDVSSPCYSSGIRYNVLQEETALIVRGLRLI